MELLIWFLLSFISVFTSRGCLALLKDDLHYYETLKISDIGSRVKRSADPNPIFHMREIWFSALGRNFHLYLKQSSLFSHDFKAKVIHKDGSRSHFEVDRTKFLSGKLKDDDNSSVTVHWDGDVMTASVMTDEDIYVVEPSWRHLENSENHTMIAYKKSDFKWNIDNFVQGVPSKFCGVADRKYVGPDADDDVVRLYPTHQQGHHRQKRMTYSYVGTRTQCRMSIVADHYFYTNIGRGDKHQTSAYVAHLMDRVSGYYTKTIWPDEAGSVTNLGLEIAEMTIYDSYQQVDAGKNHYNMAGRTNDMSKVLDMFGQGHLADFRNFCLGHLFTYQSFPGKLGLAYIASWRRYDLGGICSQVAFTEDGDMAVNTGMSTFKNPGGSTAMTLQASLTVAHGHNWGSEHDPDTDNCSPKSYNGGKYIMYPRVISGYETNNRLFSPCTRRYIFNVVKSKGYNCFSEKTGGGVLLCGNGRVDKGEECDGGYTGDTCCDRQCKLRGSSKCSPTNYACCDKLTCKAKSYGSRCVASVDNFDCKEESQCDGIHFTCPDQANKKNGTPCFDEGICKNGVCQDICQQNNRLPCICEDEPNFCSKCCRDENRKCTAIGSKTLQDGLPCYEGFCKKGKCEKSQDFVTRLFSILDILDINSFAVFMKNNVVWVVLFLTIPVWIIGIKVISVYDNNKKKREDPGWENMTAKRDITVLPEMEKHVGHRIVWNRRGAGVPFLDLPVGGS